MKTILLSVIAITLQFIKVLRSEMIVELEVMQFSNPNSKLKSGKCCSGQEGSRGRCPLMCQTFFTACLYGQEGDSCQDIHYALLQSQIMGNSTFSSSSSFSPFSRDREHSTPKTPTSKFILSGKTTQNVQKGLMLDLEAWNTKRGAAFEGVAEGTENKQNSTSWSSLIAEFTLFMGSVSDLMGTVGQWGDPVTREVEYPHSGPIFIKVRARLTCSEGYYGPTCSKHCLPRFNRVCDQNGDYICAPGYTGVQCDQFACEEGCVHGSCTGPNKCSCNFGFEGVSCDQCTPRGGCTNGGCYKNHPHTCACHTGWGGPLCDQDLEICARLKPCQNGGHCSPDPLSAQGYKCKCEKGFSGQSCEVSANCETEGYCQNGGMCSAPSSDICKCPFGWTGSRCNERASCDTVGCRNGGKCETSITSSIPRCVCRFGFMGKYCEFEDPCFKATSSDQPLCLNGGVCKALDTDGSFKCSCGSRFFGSLCEKRISEVGCEPNPCHNRGTCIKKKEGEMKCECTEEFTGKFCTEKKNPCADHPCHNGATCIEKAAGLYTCKCTFGFYGKTCDRKIKVERTQEMYELTSTEMPTTQLSEDVMTTGEPNEKVFMADLQADSQKVSKENIDFNVEVNIPKNDSSAITLNIIVFLLVFIALIGVLALGYHLIKKFRSGDENFICCCPNRKENVSFSYPSTRSNVHKNNMASVHSPLYPTEAVDKQNDDPEIGYRQKELNNFPYKEDLVKSGGHIQQYNYQQRNFKCNNLDKPTIESSQKVFNSNRNSAIPEKWIALTGTLPVSSNCDKQAFSDEQITKVSKTNNGAEDQQTVDTLRHLNHAEKKQHQEQNSNFEGTQRGRTSISRSLDSISPTNSQSYKTSRF